MRIVQLASSWPTSAMKAYTLYPCSTSHARMQEVSVDLSIRGPSRAMDNRGIDAPSPPEYANNTQPDFVSAMIRTTMMEIRRE